MSTVVPGFDFAFLALVLGICRGNMIPQDSRALTDMKDTAKDASTTNLNCGNLSIYNPNNF